MARRVGFGQSDEDRAAKREARRARRKFGLRSARQERLAREGGDDLRLLQVQITVAHIFRTLILL